MAASYTVLENSIVEGAQTHSSASLTPTADSAWVIIAKAVNADNGNTQANWNTPDDGAESYTALGGLTIDNNDVSNFRCGVRVWRQQFGSSPAARSVEIDADTTSTDTFDYKLVILEFTGHDESSRITQSDSSIATDGFGSSNLNTTSTFGATPGSGELQVAVSMATIDATITWDAEPTDFTADTTTTADRISAEISDSTTNTATGITHGTNSGDSSHMVLLIFEIAEATDALDQDAYRWGFDDGSESAHTFVENENTAMTAPVSTQRLLRVQVEETGGGDVVDGYKLQYRRDDEPTSEWRDVE